jgi:aryl sulfotransferase
MLTLPNGVVWIASYPKSGNTWMRILLSNLLAGAARPESINDLCLREGIAGSRELFEDQTLIDSHLLRPHEIEGLRPAVHDASVASKNAARFVKVHDAWSCLADGTPLLGRGARAALYLVRDPRDAAVSLAESQTISRDRAIDQMNRATRSLGPSHSQVRQWVSDWSGHVTSWLDQNSLPVYPIRYEDLRADTALVFGRALRFLGVSFESAYAEEEAILRAVRHSDFAVLQRQECENGFAERSETQESFFRAGRVGDWRRHLSEAQVRRIESAHAPAMTRLGYQLATDREAAA